MNDSHAIESTDSRIQRTRQILFQAFTELVLSQPYESIRVADIIQRAGIARSTFYQHFQNKDDILTDSMIGILETITDAAVGRGDQNALTFILEHFWENRRFGRIILNAPPYKRIIRQLASMIESRWTQSVDSGNQTIIKPPDAVIPARIQAIQLAEAQLSVIREWLSGTAACSADELARYLLTKN